MFEWGFQTTRNYECFYCFEVFGSPFKHEVRVFEIASQSIKIDKLIVLFIEQFNASKEIVHHTIELIFGVQTTLVGS